MVTTAQLQDDALDLTVMINKKLKQQDSSQGSVEILIWSFLWLEGGGISSLN